MYIAGIATEAAASAAILIPVFLILFHTRYRDGKKTVLFGIFTLYLCGIYQLVGLPNILLVPYLAFDPNLNPVPFLGLRESLVNAALNVFLFIPLGFFLPVLWKKYVSFRATLGFGFAATVIIEFLQIFYIPPVLINHCCVFINVFLIFFFLFFCFSNYSI